MSNDALPDDDAKFLGRVIDAARQVYGSAGKSEPVGFVQHAADQPELSVVTSNAISGSTASDRKLLFADLIRYFCLTTDARRVALVTEGLTVFPSSDAMTRQVIALQQSGRSIREHPECAEAVFITVESEFGTTMCQMRINRMHATMVELIEAGRDFYNRDDPRVRQTGTFANLYIPVADRANSNAKEFLDYMNELLERIINKTSRAVH